MSDDVGASVPPRVLVRYSLGNAWVVILVAVVLLAFAGYLVWDYNATGFLPRRRGGGTASAWDLYLLGAGSLYLLYTWSRRFFDDRPVVVIDGDGLVVRRRGIFARKGEVRFIPWARIEHIERYPASEKTLISKRLLLVHLRPAGMSHPQETVRIDWLGLDPSLDEAMRAGARFAPEKFGSI